MDHSKILLSKDISNEEKIKTANDIIINYELSLNADQILLAFKNIISICVYVKRREDYIRYIIFLLNELLKINKNMYTAIILALCDGLFPPNLVSFLVFEKGVPSTIGLFYDFSINYYFKLLDYYEFDVINISGISEKNKQIIQVYRVTKYSGKLTKCATKK